MKMMAAAIITAIDAALKFFGFIAYKAFLMDKKALMQGSLFND
ncbi:hypothetical protein [Methanocella conradii]|nr:hypothetical protein [Methanocella conradii]